MEFRILGPLDVFDGARHVDVGGPKQRAVLAVLLLSANRVVSVDKLIDELWGDEAPSAATATLQAYVSNLRRALEPHRAPRQPAQVLVTRAPGYVLHVPREDLDAARFEDLAAAGHRLVGQRRHEAARETLEEALREWRGPALADFGFEPFGQAEIARLEGLRLGAVEDRLTALVDLGRHAEAVAEAEALVAEHPLRERLWALLMVSLYRSGRQADALRAYQSARHRLAEELGIEPSPSLRRLEADMLAQAPSLEWHPPVAPEPAAAAAGAAEPAGAAAAPEPAGEEKPLVGRAEELTRLRAALVEAGSGRGRVVVIGGEPGIGKTRLAEALVDEARRAGARVAWGGSVEGGGTPAYWPWVGVIGELLRSADPDQVRQAVSSSAADLAQIVPEVKELAGTVEALSAVDPETGRLRLFESVVAFLRSLAQGAPLVVVLDDLQWADAASLQLLGFVGAKLRGASLLVLGTYRPAEVGPSHPLTDALAALARHQVSERIQLSGLPEAGVADLIASTTGAAPEPQVVQAIRARTEGNPFFVAELARLLTAEHDLRADAMARAVPAGVRDVVRRRVARLPEQTTALLSLAAVAGQAFDLHVLEAAAGLDGEQALELVEAALASGLVVEDAEVVGRFRFSHDLVRQTIADELTALRRARLHARFAEALEGEAVDDDRRAVELAHHFFHAAPAIGAAKAVTWAVRAADVEAGRLAHEQAEQQLWRALDLTGRLPGGAERDSRELEVLLRLVSLLSMTRGYAAPAIGEVLDRASALAQKLGERRDIIRVLYGLMTFHLVGARHDLARGLADQLLELTAASDDVAERFPAHAAVGVTALHQGQLEVSRHHFETALALTDALLDPWLCSWFPLDPEVSCGTFVAWALQQLGEREAAFRHAVRAVERAKASRHDLSIAHALHLCGHMQTLERDPATVLRHEDEVVAFCEEKGFPLYAALGTVLRGWALAAEGEPDAGVAAIREGMAAMEATGAEMVHTFYLGLLAEAQLLARHPDDARASLDAAFNLVEATGERFFEAELHRLLGEVLLATGEGDAAEEELRRAVEIARAAGARTFELRAEESLRRLAVG